MRVCNSSTLYTCMILVHSVLWVALCCAGLALLVLTDRFAAALMGLKAGEIVQGVCWVWVSWKHSSPVPLDLLCVCCSGHPGSTTLLCIALGTLEAAPAVPLALLCCSGYVGSTALLCPWLCCVLLWVPWKPGSPVPWLCCVLLWVPWKQALFVPLALRYFALVTLEAQLSCVLHAQLSCVLHALCVCYMHSSPVCVTCTALLCVTRTVCVLHALCVLHVTCIALLCVTWKHSSPVCYMHCASRPCLLACKAGRVYSGRVHLCACTA